MRTLYATFLLALVVSGCHRQNSTLLGKAPEGEIRTVLAVRAGDTPRRVTLSGIMVEKCPTAGCWLRLKDSTGIIKVDTKAAGFVVVKVPLDTHVTVMGDVVTVGDEVVVAATGLSY
jgi:uncharacterized protein YdeI (BOF family)